MSSLAKVNPMPSSVAPDDNGDGHPRGDTHTSRAVPDSLCSAKEAPIPAPIAPSTNGKGQKRVDPQTFDALAESSNGSGQRPHVAHSKRAAPDSSNGSGQVPAGPQARGARADNFNGHTSRESQSGTAVESEGIGHATGVLQKATADPSDALLLILADALDDLERQRIASENRLRSLQQVKGLAGSKAETQLDDITEALKDLEKRAEKELARAMRAHRFGPWVKARAGMGDKQTARLLAAIGDPYIRPPIYVDGEMVEESRPRRGPAELWAYCGYVPGQRRRTGVRSNWNAEAKMRAFLCAEKVCMLNGVPDKNGRPRARSGYRDVYEAARAKHADAVHDAPCAQCGPAGKPAQPGSPLSAGHQEARALRVVAKEILKGLWREGRRLHSLPDDHSHGEPPSATTVADGHNRCATHSGSAVRN